MPGGFGTLDELFEAITLIQTRRIKSFPIVMVGTSYWSGLIDWVREQMLQSHPTIEEDDLHIFQILDDPDEIIRYIKRTVII